MSAVSKHITLKGRTDTEPSEDGRKTLAAVPTPLRSIPATGSDTDTNDRGDDGIGGRNRPGETGGNGKPC